MTAVCFPHQRYYTNYLRFKVEQHLEVRWHDSKPSSWALANPSSYAGSSLRSSSGASWLDFSSKNADLSKRALLEQMWKWALPQQCCRTHLQQDWARIHIQLHLISIRDFSLAFHCQAVNQWSWMCTHTLTSSGPICFELFIQNRNSQIERLSQKLIKKRMVRTFNWDDPGTCLTPESSIAKAWICLFLIPHEHRVLSRWMLWDQCFPSPPGP